jgi:hypothetical protein
MLGQALRLLLHLAWKGGTMGVARRLQTYGMLEQHQFPALLMSLLCGSTAIN